MNPGPNALRNSNTQYRISSSQGSSPVDAFEQHRELCGRQRDRPAVCQRPDKSPPFEPLLEETKSIAIGPKQLHHVAAPPTKDEDMARERLLLEYRLDLGAEPDEASAH